MAKEESVGLMSSRGQELGTRAPDADLELSCRKEAHPPSLGARPRLPARGPPCGLAGGWEVGAQSRRVLTMGNRPSEW